jgi:hypothetical protein
MRVSGFTPINSTPYSFSITMNCTVAATLSVEQNGTMRSSSTYQIGVGYTTITGSFTVDGSANSIVFVITTGISAAWSASWTAFQLFAMSGSVNGDMIMYNNVGIGATPSYKLHVEGTADNVISYTRNLQASGYVASYWGTDQASVGVIFKNGSGRTPDGGANTMTVRNDGGDLRLQSSAGASGPSTCITIASTGNVGINITTPGYTLHVAGSIYAANDITAFSDQRYKQNIIRLDRSLDAIRSLNGYSYTREDYRPGERQIGLLAQEVKEILPEAVSYDSINDKYSVNYNCLTAPIVEAIKELYDRVDAQAKTIEKQQAMIQQLMDRIGPL